MSITCYLSSEIRTMIGTVWSFPRSSNRSSLLVFLVLWCSSAQSFYHGIIYHSSKASSRWNAIPPALNGGQVGGKEEDVQDILRLIRGPLGNQEQKSRLRPKRILILSDSTGLMAKSAVEKTLAQFNGCGDDRFFLVKQTSASDAGGNEEDDQEEDGYGYDESCENISTKMYPFINSEEQVASILKQTTEGYEALVVYTFADPILREQTRRMCELSQFGHVDLLSPMFDAMSALLDQQPLGDTFQFDGIDDDATSLENINNTGMGPGKGAAKSLRKGRRSLSDKYFRRIEAVEYTLKCDDGKSPKDWHEADLILCGVSRTGKTPLSVVLAQTMGLKVANIPLVVDLPPPQQLFEVDPQRVFMLTLSLNDLIRIRRYRLRKMGTRQGGMARSTYADPAYLIRDLDHARQLASQHGFTEIDVTGRAVEETASVISALLNRRFPQVRI